MKKIFLTLLILSGKFCAQNDDRSVLRSLLDNDSSSAVILLSYPDTARSAILTAATYPQGFTRLSEIQVKTAASFKSLLSDYRQKKQKQLWDLTRYPGLLATLITSKDRTDAELATLLGNYPKGTKEACIYFVKHDLKVLSDMETIRVNFETEYKTIVKDFPSGVQISFNLLLRDPELLSILTGDIRTTITLGDVYQRNPGLVKHLGDSVRSKVMLDDRQELEDWKAGIARDTSVQKELKQVSKKYQEETGYEDDVYNNGPGVTNVNSVTPPYPFWAGYPYWYQTPYWYPYPWWYHSGFYWSPFGSIVVFGMPTYHFGWWYYNHPGYHRRYMNTSNYFNHHFENHPRSFGNFSRSVRDWNVGRGGGMPRSTMGGRGFGGGGRRR